LVKSAPNAAVFPVKQLKQDHNSLLYKNFCCKRRLRPKENEV